MPYELRALAEDDGCSSLSLGLPTLVSLKTFLRKEAKRLQGLHDDWPGKRYG